MPTLKELMGDKTRGDGRKFARLSWDNDRWYEPIFYYEKEKCWFGLNTDGCLNEFSDSSDSSKNVCGKFDFDDWQEWTPPKQTKKVKLYRPIFESPMPGKYVVGDEAATSKDLVICPAKPVGWQEMEVEVEE